MNNQSAAGAVYPANTKELFIYILKQLPSRLKKALPRTLIFGLLGWLLHTYLLVVVNEGFSPDTWLGKNVLNVKGNLLSSTLFWALLIGIFPLIFSFFKKGGNPFKRIGEIFSLPKKIMSKNKSSGGYYLPYMLIACGVMLLIDRVFSGLTGILAGGIIINSAISFITGRGGILVQTLRMAANDIQIFILRKKQSRLDNESVYMIVGASGMTLLAAGILKTLKMPAFVTTAVSYAWIVLLAAGIFFLIRNGRAPKTIMLLAGFFGMTYILREFGIVNVFADDGGWAEAGGTFSGWIGSQGSGTAVASGIPPALGGVIGSYVSSIMSGLFTGLETTLPGVATGAVPPVDLSGIGQNIGYNGEPDPGQVPATDSQPPQDQQQNEPAISDEERLRIEQEQERIRQEQERIRQEEEKLRQELQRRAEEERKRQEEIKRKALEDLKKAKEEKDRHDAYVASLCKKYNTTPDKLRDVLRQNIKNSQADADYYNNKAAVLTAAITTAQVAATAADAAIDGLAEITGPAGKTVRAVYKVTKGAASTMAEEGISGTSLAKGLVKGGADAATDYTQNKWAKAGLTVAGEAVGGAISGGVDGFKKGLVDGVVNAGTNVVVDKIGGDGFGNEKKFTFAGDKSSIEIKLSNGDWVKKTYTQDTAYKYFKKVTDQQATQSMKKFGANTVNETVIKPLATTPVTDAIKNKI
ncbi:MAG: hypothetical protein PHG48_03130 [Eubacteriales bacterium]|nr:hypothetical protein [Eubacteriales bacterium]